MVWGSGIGPNIDGKAFWRAHKIAQVAAVAAVACQEMSPARRQSNSN